MDNNESFDFSSEFSLDTQKRFLTLLVYEKDWAELTGMDLILPEYFENKILRNICYWIHKHYKKYKSTPSMTVLVEMASTFVNETAGLSTRDYYKYKEVLDYIFNLGEKENLEFFKDKAITFAKQVAWRKAMNEAVNFLKCDKYADAVKLFSDIAMIGSEENLGTDFSSFDIGSFLSNLNKTFDPKTMIHTGIPHWDKALGGGFVKENLHIIGACFTGDTRVKTNLGWKRIDDLINLFKTEEITIYSYDGKKKIKSKIKDVFETKKVNQIMYLKFNNGKTVKCTPDHLFVIKNPKENDMNLVWENGIAYKQAQYLGEEDEF